VGVAACSFGVGVYACGMGYGHPGGVEEKTKYMVNWCFVYLAALTYLCAFTSVSQRMSVGPLTKQCR